MSANSFLDYHGLQTFKGKLDEVFAAQEQAYSKIETIVVSTTMTGDGSTVSATINDNKIESDMVVLNAVVSNLDAQKSDLSWSTNTPGRCTLSGQINGTTTVTLYLGKSR